MYHEPRSRFWSDTVEVAGEFALNLIGEAVSGLLEGLFNL
jgi:hypothetical protein